MSQSSERTRYFNAQRQARWRRRKREEKAGLSAQPSLSELAAGVLTQVDLADWSWLGVWLAENPIDWAQFDTDLSWLDSEVFEFN